MARIVALDYGLKRVGVAATDPLQIIASPVDTIATDSIFSFLEDYFSTEDVEKLVIGLPSETAHSYPSIIKFSKEIQKKWPNLALDFQDEDFTSAEASNAMVQGGMKKKNRRKKENLDKISAVIILQRYMEI